MGRLRSLSVCLILLLVFSLASSGPAKEKKRRGAKKTLSDKEHYTDGDKHNTEYDHEAFLGKEQAKTFSELPPAEAKRRLGLIVDKIDTDKDGSLNEDELVAWIRQVSRRYVFDDRDRHWKFLIKDDAKYISLEDYIDKAYGMIEDRTKIHDPNRNLTYNDVIERYNRRFASADRDGNKLLDKDEFADFIHPHDVPHMKNIVIDETHQELDKDRNGKITMEEYLADMKRSYGDNHPDWKEQETDLFKNHRDKNGNGEMDREEVEEWLYPPNSDPAVNEARHLFHHADADQDKKLTKSEILEQQDVFVGSQATEHGRFFVRHDEF